MDLFSSGSLHSGRRSLLPVARVCSHTICTRAAPRPGLFTGAGRTSGHPLAVLQARAGQRKGKRKLIPAFRVEASGENRNGSGTNGLGRAMESEDDEDAESRSHDIEAELRERKRRLEAERSTQALASDLVPNQKNRSRSTTLQWRPKTFWHDLDELKGRLAYNYFNWRQDTWSDLLLFGGLNMVLLLMLGAVKGIIDNGDTGPVGNGLSALWLEIYGILVIIFGQELPDTASSAILQAFSVVVAAMGLALFALVLALIEQVVLEVLDSNVRKGSVVYETGHLLVLAWADNRRDEETVWKILTQACLAYRNDGGIVIVVLCQREKLEMEAACRRIIPPNQRYGSQFVFRHGSPLVPDNLREVAAAQAGAIIVVSDSNRPPDEADAEAIRAGVLLDELDFPGFGVEDPRKATIIVDVHESSSVELLQYCCSSRVIAVPTWTFNARRISRMVRNPVLAILGSQMWSFDSVSQCYIQYFPQLVAANVTYGDLFRYFPDGTVVGLFDREAQKCTINPSSATPVTATTEVVVLRPTSLPGCSYEPSSTPVAVDIGGWDCKSYVRRTHSDSYNGSLMKSLDGSREDLLADSPFVIYPADAANGTSHLSSQCKFLYILPSEYISSSDEPEQVLITGWGELTFMQDLLKALDSELPKGSEITLFNERTGVLGQVNCLGLSNISVLHVTGNPLRRMELLSRLDIRRFKCAIILVDQAWVDPDLDAHNGVQLRSQSDMLRLDSLSMAVQLNIRKLLQDAGLADINIIAEKTAFEGLTRFEDKERLPLGTNFNLTAYGANMLLQAAVSPKVMKAFVQFGRQHVDTVVQDSSCFAAVDEELSYWEVLARASAVQQTLLGYFEIPVTIDNPLDMVFNPQGEEVRSRKRIWNRGNNRIKFMTIINKPRNGEKQKQGTSWDEPSREAPATEMDYSTLSTLLTQDPALGGLPIMPREID